jgi:hypothetical protein
VLFRSGRFDSGKREFCKKMLQTVLPNPLRVTIMNKLFNQFVGISESVLAKELYCNVEQLKLMKRQGMFIGLHGFYHERLGEVEFEKEINFSLDYMVTEELVNKQSWVMCYPYGSWCDNLLTFIAGKGCIIGLTTNVGIANYNGHNPLLLPRFDTNDFPPKSENYILQLR